MWTAAFNIEARCIYFSISVYLTNQLSLFYILLPLSLNRHLILPLSWTWWRRWWWWPFTSLASSPRPPPTMTSYCPFYSWSVPYRCHCWRGHMYRSWKAQKLWRSRPPIQLLHVSFHYPYHNPLLDSLVVECWLRVREVPGSIPSQGPRLTKDVLKMVPVALLFSTEH